MGWRRCEGAGVPRKQTSSLAIEPAVSMDPRLATDAPPILTKCDGLITLSAATTGGRPAARVRQSRDGATTLLAKKHHVGEIWEWCGVACGENEV